MYITRFTIKIKIHTAYQRPAYPFSAAPFCMRRPTSVQKHPARSMKISWNAWKRKKNAMKRWKLVPFFRNSCFFHFAKTHRLRKIRTVYARFTHSLRNFRGGPGGRFKKLLPPWSCVILRNLAFLVRFYCVSCAFLWSRVSCVSYAFLVRFLRVSHAFLVRFSCVSLSNHAFLMRFFCVIRVFLRKWRLHA